MRFVGSVMVCSVLAVLPAYGQETQEPTPFDQPLVISEIEEADNSTTRKAPRETLEALRGNLPTTRQPRDGLISNNGFITPVVNQRVQKEQGRFQRRSDALYAPLGLRAGSFLIFPTLSQSIGTTSNADSVAEGRRSAFSQTGLRVRAQSDWSRHNLSAEFGINHQEFFDDDVEDYTQADGNVSLDLNLRGGLDVRLEAGVDLRPEGLASENLNLPVGSFVLERPNVTAYRGAVRLRRSAGVLQASMNAELDYRVYDDAALNNGLRLSQSDRNNAKLTAVGRLQYATGAVLQPFVEGEIGLRVYDDNTDRNDQERDSRIVAARAGVSVDRGEVLSGEFAAGYRAETLESDGFSALNAFTVDGQLVWAPSDGVKFTVSGETTFETAVQFNESGSIIHAVGLRGERQLRDNLTITSSALLAKRDYVGGAREDTIYQFTAGGEWKLNRSVAVFGQVGHEITESNAPDADYSATTAQIGLRLSR